MSLKSAALFSLFTGVSFIDLQRAATRQQPVRGTTPSALEVAQSTRFAPAAQVSLALTEPVAVAAIDILAHNEAA